HPGTAPVILHAVLDGTRSIQNKTGRISLSNASENSKMHVEGWIPKAGNAPLAAVIPKRPVAEASWVPSGRTKKQMTCTIPNPQGPAAQTEEARNKT
ncbi:MAG: hypothetical protein IK132_01135, partial [Clostridia bacterium]|nr:hypothetical protein [Clostridia bacterium]